MVEADDELLAEWLLQWEELYERGQDTPASELAKARPDLIDALSQRIAVLKSAQWLDRGDDGDDPPPPEERGPRSDAPPKLLAGRYRLDELIAEGGFAQVFRAYDRDLQRTVALKLPKASRLESTDAFLAEARRVARLKHPGLVQVYDVGVENNLCFFVSEYVEGGSLADRLTHTKPACDMVVRWISDIADALEYAHLHGVIHRDIKPANILIDHHGRALLADFGIAQSASKTGKFAPSLGTLRYMSPEQLEGKPSDHRSDIYSLAVVLHEALTGQLPYSSLEPNVLRKEIVRGPHAAVEMPSAIRRVCSKALRKSLHERHPSAALFGSELRRAVSQKPRPRLVLMASAACLLGVGTAAGVLWNRQPRDIPQVSPQASFEEVLAVAQTDLSQNHHIKAEQGFSQALMLRPDSAEALAKRGESRIHLKAFQSAIEDLTRALALGGDEPVILRRRATAYALMRQFQPAIDDLLVVVSKKPEWTEAKEQLATVFAIRSHDLFNKGEYRDAARDMDAAISYAPSAAINYHRRGACYFHLGEYQKAIDDLTVAIDKEPSKAEHYENRAQSLLRLERNDEAEKDLAKAKALRQR